MSKLSALTRNGIIFKSNYLLFQINVFLILWLQTFSYTYLFIIEWRRLFKKTVFLQNKRIFLINRIWTFWCTYVFISKLSALTRKWVMFKSFFVFFLKTLFIKQNYWKCMCATNIEIMPQRNWVYCLPNALLFMKRRLWSMVTNWRASRTLCKGPLSPVDITTINGKQK